MKEPYCTRLSLTTCYGLRILTGRLRMAGGVEIPLNHYVQRFLSQPRIEVRSVTLTTESLSISVRRKIEPINCEGMLGIDRNLNNVTLADTENRVQRYDLSTVTTIKSRSRRTKARFARNDARVKGRIFRKYGRIQRDRVNWLLHNASASIVLRAKLKREAIVMEDLRGIRKLYQKGNGQGTHFRSRMNSWSFAELERQIKYKADWNGIPVIYVSPHGTSAKCSMCGHRVLPEEDRQLHCPNCGLVVDRDANAARNILARGLRFKPVGPAGEAMVQEHSTRELLLKVDAGQSTSKLIA